ncbi:sporulation membrane protein YtaF [Candidatus Contubernalis alkaliaceticus]|uniref:sporulation membrane protein YtaF n=1 Tax=Candidatus Contubernalis alkaliaceticus TaxID=338645 RepID=UPI001F4C32E9|nr:sporulation membrane protein YtaF [Candidatus Contubernalis alkalaceticus]UNC91598.1 sporulation membrane protein YtaF [Candidatus Contubernalis alkalaceticus]
MVELSILLSIILLGLAVSLDGFGVGMAYGVRNMRLPFLSIIIISLSSALAIMFSMLTGKLVSAFFSPEAASMVGGIMLVGIGTWISFQAFLNVKRLLPGEETEYNESLNNAKGGKNVSDGRYLSFFSDILKDPQKADFDRSGEIRGGEAVALGVALAMDAFGAGFGAAMMGFNPFITSAAVGAAKLVMLPAGFYLGNYYFSKHLGSKASYLSGFVLIVLGMLNLFNVI